MANLKRFTIGYTTGGSTPYVSIKRVSDGFFWNGSAFTSSAFLNAMTQDFPGFWVYETSSTIWDSGTYYVAFYGGSTSTQPVLAAYPQVISGDTQVGFIEASSITSRNTVAAFKTDLQAVQDIVAKQEIALGVLSDKIDSQNQILARREYNQ